MEEPEVAQQTDRRAQEPAAATEAETAATGGVGVGVGGIGR